MPHHRHESKSLVSVHKGLFVCLSSLIKHYDCESGVKPSIGRVVEPSITVADNMKVCRALEVKANSANRVN